MKCNCGYEREYDWETKTYTGDTDFIETGLIAVFEKNGGYYPITDKKIVWACPECGALKIDMGSL